MGRILAYLTALAGAFSQRWKYQGSSGPQTWEVTHSWSDAYGSAPQVPGVSFPFLGSAETS